MPNREVNLTKRIRLTDGSTRFCPVVLSANGRVKPDYVLVDEKQERHTEGNYYLDWYEGTQRKRVSVGKDAQDAAAARLKKEAELNARSLGVAVAATESHTKRKLLADAIDKYLKDTKRDKKGKTFAAYSKSLEYFQESCPKSYVEDVTRDDLKDFAAFLRDEKELAPRTCWNKFLTVVSFLKDAGVQTSGNGGLLKKGDWPEFTEEEPEAFEQEELDALFSACNE